VVVFPSRRGAAAARGGRERGAAAAPGAGCRDLDHRRDKAGRDGGRDALAVDDVEPAVRRDELRRERFWGEREKETRKRGGR